MSVRVTITDKDGRELAAQLWDAELAPGCTISMPERLPVKHHDELIGWLIRRAEPRVVDGTVRIEADFEALPVIPEHLKGSLALLDDAYTKARMLYADSLGDGIDPEAGIIAPEGSEWSFTKMPRPDRPEQ